MIRKTKSSTNGWNEYKKLFESEMILFHKRFDKIDDDIVDLKVTVGQLTTKSGVWGIVGSVVAVALILGAAGLKAFF